MSQDAAAVAATDLDIERLVRLDQQIDANESTALRARWEFGQQMLQKRGTRSQFKDGYLSRLTERTGKSRRELQYRARFAEMYPTEEDLCNALHRFTAWREIAQSLKASKDAEDNAPAEPQPAPEGKYSTFVADPPWQYGNTSTRGAAENHYETMTIEELCALDVVPEHAADQAHLYLWTTAGHLPQAFDVMEAWGFQYKTYLVWCKPQLGMGNYFRVSTELVLFGVRGGMRTQARDISNWFTAKRAKHSAKPIDFPKLVMKASPGPYMELFSRCRAPEMLTGCTCSKCRYGWTVWGDQS